MTTPKNRLNWTEQQDNIIKSLRQEMNINSWKNISKKLNRKLKEKKRSPKQCRERYMNYLRFVNQQENMSDWSSDQQKVLFRSFLELGPKWVKIAINLPGKSQNNIKNKFYGTIRKFLRKMNKLQKQRSRKSKKQIKYECLIKLLSLINFQGSCGNNQKTNVKSAQFLQLRSQILEYLCLYDQNQQLLLIFAEKLHQFSASTRFLNRNKSKAKQKVKNQAMSTQNGNNQSFYVSKQSMILQSDIIDDKNQERVPIVNQTQQIMAKQSRGQELDEIVSLKLDQYQERSIGFRQNIFDVDINPFQFFF